MKYSEWFGEVTKPDLNGVYQGRNSSEPDEIKYHLYKNGWHIGCDSIGEAAMMVEKLNTRLNSEIRAATPKVIIFGSSYKESPHWEWRGLAEKPKGNYQVETSDKYKNWGATNFR